MHQYPGLRLFFAVILALGLTGCARGTEQEAPATPVPSAGVSGSFAVDVVAASAVVVPYREATLNIRASGRLAEVHVAEGDTVVAGQSLARVDARDLEQSVFEAEAGLKSAQAGLAKARAGARPEEISVAQAAVTIADVGVKVAEDAVSVAESGVAAAQADAKAADGTVEVAQGNLAAAQAAQSSSQAALNKLLAGPTSTQLQIAAKEMERAQNELYALQSQRDATRNMLEGQLAAAQNVVDIARLRLDELKAGPRTEDVAAARAQLAQAVAGVQTARGQLTEAQARVAQAAAGVRTAEAQLAQARTQVESAQAQADQARARLEQTRAGNAPEDIAAAEAAVAQAEAALAAARNALDDAELRAPFAGTIGAVLVQAGELVTPQTPVIRLGDLTRVRVQTEDLGETDVGLLRNGQEAEVTVDALGTKRIKATVARIAPAAVDRRGDKVYPVLLDIDPAEGAGLRWGMSAYVEIKVR